MTQLDRSRLLTQHFATRVYDGRDLVPLADDSNEGGDYRINAETAMQLIGV